MKTTSLAFAKLNLTLAVHGQREDGFHEIESVVQTIDLADRIEVSVRPGAGIFVENTLADIQGPDLAERAAAAWLVVKNVSLHVEIRIRKGIPAGAGLGGGSSDAAAVLQSLDRLVPPRLADEDLRRLAAGIGSDVTLFLVGGCVRITGRGEIVERLPGTRSERFVVVVPPARCPTADVYGAWAAHRTPCSGAAPAFGSNDLLAPALAVCPELRRVEEAVAHSGGLYSGMSGSGSSFYVAFSNEDQADAGARGLRAALPECAVFDCAATSAGMVLLEGEDT
jgi:4-diphosphocytidyl-2-C-methyl-D-erythritol kinase